MKVVFFVFATVLAALVAVNILARHEHLVAKVAVAILDIRVLIVPHQLEPLLYGVEPDSHKVEEVVQVLGGVHDFPILLV